MKYKIGALSIHKYFQNLQFLEVGAYNFNPS